MNPKKKRSFLLYLKGKNYRYLLISIICISVLIFGSCLAIAATDRHNAQINQTENYDLLKNNTVLFEDLLGRADAIVDTINGVKQTVACFSAASPRALDAALLSGTGEGLQWISAANEFAPESDGRELCSLLFAITNTSTVVDSVILYAKNTGCSVGTFGGRFFLAHSDEELHRVFKTETRWRTGIDCSLVLVPGLKAGEQTLYYLRAANHDVVVLMGLKSEAVGRTLFKNNAGRSYKLEQMVLHLPNGGLSYMNSDKGIGFLGRTWDVLASQKNVFFSNTYTVMRYSHDAPYYTLSIVLSKTSATDAAATALFFPFIIVNGLWMLLVAGICAYILIHFNHPIESILQSISADNAEDISQSGQLKLIDDTLKRYHQTIARSKEEVDEQRRQLRRIYLGKLALDRNTYLSDEQLETLHIPSVLSRYFIIVAYPSNGRWTDESTSDQEQAYQRHVKLAALIDIMRTANLQHRAEYLFCHAKLLIVMTLSEEDNMDELMSRAIEGTKAFSRHLGRSLQVGVSDIYEGGASFSSAYRGALRKAAPVDRREGRRSVDIQLSTLIKQNMHIADLIYVEHYSGALLCFREVIETLFCQENPGLRRQQIQSYLALVLCMLTETSEMNAELLDDTRLLAPGLFDDKETLLQVWEEAFGKLDARKSTKMISQYTEQFAAAYQYMHAHFRDAGFSQSMLAAEFGMSPSTLSREFQKNIGKGFLETLHQFRVEAAKYEIEHSNASMNDIAEAVGYTNALTMTRAFKKYLGNTPGAYRKTDGESTEE